MIAVKAGLTVTIYGGPDPADLLPRAGILLGLAATDRDDDAR